MTLFDARSLARGWLSVALASSSDDDRPALHRTISIEAYPEGLRLTATDSFMLLTCWVPNLDDDLATPPSIDEPPYSTAVAMDPHARAKGFLAHAAKLAKALGPDADPLPVQVRLGVIDDSEPDDGLVAFDGFEVPYVHLELPDGAERLKLRCYEGPFPNWRPILSGFTPEATDRITLNPDIVGRLAEIDKIQPGCYLRFRWGGTIGAAHVETHQASPHVQGIVMPVRWDFARNEPRTDTAPEDGTPADDADTTEDGTDG